jgi:hypothetical protein
VAYDRVKPTYLMLLPYFGPGWLSRYSDSLRTKSPGTEPRLGPPSLVYDEYRVISGGKAAGA